MSNLSCFYLSINILGNICPCCEVYSNNNWEKNVVLSWNYFREQINCEQLSSRLRLKDIWSFSRIINCFYLRNSWQLQVFEILFTSFVQWKELFSLYMEDHQSLRSHHLFDGKNWRVCERLYLHSHQLQELKEQSSHCSGKSWKHIIGKSWKYLYGPGFMWYAWPSAALHTGIPKEQVRNFKSCWKFLLTWMQCNCAWCLRCAGIVCLFWRLGWARLGCTFSFEWMK